MSSRRVGAINFSDECRRLLNEYGQDVHEIINDSCKESADTAVKMLKHNSRKNTGKYARDWTKRQEKAWGFGTSYKVYNRKHYRVAHLLEYPHDKANQYGTYGTTKGDGVIADVEDYVTALLENLVIRRLG